MKKFRKIVTMLLCGVMSLGVFACTPDGGSGAEGATAADAVIWCAPASVKVLSTQNIDNYSDERTDKVVLSAVRNEYESGQIIVTPSKNLAYTVELSDLTGANGAKITKDNFKVYTQTYVSVVRNWYGNGAPTGMYPDPIVPQENAVEYGLNAVNAGRNGGTWLEFFIPKDAPVGKYTGTATVDLGKEKVNVPVELTVHDYVLPDEITQKSLFTVNLTQLSEYELDSTESMIDKYTELLMYYRLAPSGVSAGGDGYDERISKWVEKAYKFYQKGLRTIAIPTFYTNNRGLGYVTVDPDLLAQSLVALAKKSLAVGIDLNALSCLYDYEIDEPFYASYVNGRVADSIIEFDKGVNKALEALTADPGFETELGAKIIESVRKTPHVITDYYDDLNRIRDPIKNKDGTPFTYEGKNVALCPKPDGVDTAERRAYYDNGFEKWWYTCNDPKYPYPTYHVDDTMTSAMSIGWFQAEYGITGNLYWCSNYFIRNGVNMSNPYSSADRASGANGDGAILYPGKMYGVDGPVASIRLDAIRDGYEDYELIKKLYEAYEENGESAAAIFHTLSSTLYNGSSIVGGYEEYESAREVLIALLEAVNSDAKLMITSATESEDSLGNKHFSYTVKAADGAVVKSDEAVIEKTGDGYTVEKTLEKDENYLSLSAEKNGVTKSVSVYLGGKQIVVGANSFADTDFEGFTDITLEDGRAKFTLGGENENKTLVIKHETVSGINAKTGQYILYVYNYGESIDYTVYVTFSGYGKVESLSGKLKPGLNELILTEFPTVNWSSRKSVTSLSLEVAANEIGLEKIIVYGV